MNEEFQHLSMYAKKGLAAILFLFLLIGGAAAVLSVLAAGLNALSGPVSFSVASQTTGVAVTQGNANPSHQAGSTTATPANSSVTEPQSGWVGSGTVGSGTVGSGTVGSSPSATQAGSPTQSAAGSTPGTSSGTPTATSEAATGGRNTLETPVVEALDRGGVVVGNQVQQAFGNVLANILQVLFVERPVPTPSNSTAVPTGGNGQ